MSALPEARPRGGVFSLTISLGNILSLLAMLVAGAFAWAEVQTSHEVLKTKFEMFREEQQRREETEKKFEALERKIDQRFLEIKRRMQ